MPGAKNRAARKEEKDGKKIKDRAGMAQERVLEETCVEYVTDYNEAPDFVDVYGRAAGDCLCFRVYDNGDMYER